MRTLSLVFTLGLVLFSGAHAGAQQPSAPSKGSTSIPGHNPRETPDQQRDGSLTLGPTYHEDKCGLDYTTATQKLGMRFPLLNNPSVAQPATFTISGIPGTAIIEKAFIWCDASGSGIPITISVTNPASNNASYNMTLIGSDADKCWGYAGSHSYRADITGSISGNGNYVISGFPTNPPTSGEDTDGATMMVIWSDASAGFQGNITIWDGALVIAGGTTTQTINNFSNTCANSTLGRAFLCVADLQNLGATLSMNGSLPFTINEDWWNYVEQPTIVGLNQNTASYTINSGGDCYNFCMMGLYYQTTCLACCFNTFTSAITPLNPTCNQNNGSATATPSGGNAPYTYSWNTVPVQTTQTATNLGPGQYIVAITDATNCTTYDTITLTSNSFTVTPASTNLLCAGGATGSATVTGTTGPYTYAWTPSGGNNATATGLPAGNYTCTITDANGCSQAQTFIITQPPVIVMNSTGNSGCAGTGGIISAQATGGTPGFTYSWDNNLPNGSSQLVNPVQSTTYIVTATDANGCTAMDTVTYYVNPFAVASFTTPAVNGQIVLDFFNGPQQLCMTNTSQYDSTWNWTMNGSNATNTESPCFTVSDTGLYCLLLIASNPAGCNDSTLQCIEVIESSFFIPNVITPNGDGMNDVFIISSRGLKSLHCTIYNRWGQLVYEYDGPGGTWNAIMKNGDFASDGTYYFVADIVDAKNEARTETGFFQLIKDR